MLRRRRDTTLDSVSGVLTSKKKPVCVRIGPGINPSVVNGGMLDSTSSSSTSNNPPIVNTGNSGPMCVQPGDWICGTCGFVVSKLTHVGNTSLFSFVCTLNTHSPSVYLPNTIVELETT